MVTVDRYSQCVDGLGTLWTTLGTFVVKGQMPFKDQGTATPEGAQRCPIFGDIEARQYVHGLILECKRPGDATPVVIARNEPGDKWWRWVDAVPV